MICNIKNLLYVFSTIFMVNSLLANENLIQNPYMLKGKDGKIANWVIPQGVITNHKTLVQVAAKDPDKGITLFQNLKALPNVDYLLEYDYRSLTGADVRIYCEEVRKDAVTKKSKYKTYFSGRRSAPTEWTHVTIPVRLEAGWSHFYVAMRMVKGTGNVHVKNLRFTKAPTLPKVIGGHWQVSLPHKLNAKGTSVVIQGDKKPNVSINAIPVKPGFEYRIDYVAIGKSKSGNQSSAMHVYGTKISPEVPGGVLFQDLYQFGTQAKHHKFKIPASSSIRLVNLTIVPSTPGTIELKDFKITETPIDNTTSWRIQLDYPHVDGVYSTVAATKVTGKIIADVSATKAFVSINDKNKVEVKLVKGIGNFNLTLPAPLGKYNLKCQVIRKNGAEKVLTQTIIKCAPSKNAVKFPDGKHFTVGGKPFFPTILWYGSQYELEEHKIAYLAAHGVNTLFTNPWPHRRKKDIYLNILNIAWKYKVRVFLGCGNPENMDELPAFKKLVDTLYVSEVVNHPAFLGVFLVDEPLWRGTPRDPLFALYSYMKEKMPNHQIFINAAPRYEIEDLRPYSQASDFYGVDVYPIPYPNHHSGIDDKTPSSLGKYAKRMLEVVHNRKPIVMSLQGGSWSEWGTGGAFKRYPTESELRFMAMDSLTNGAAACAVWGFGHIRSVKYVDTLMTLFSELHKVSRIFSEGKQEKDLPVKDCRIAVYKHGKNIYYVALNPTGKKVTTTVALPDKPQQVTFYLDNKTVKTPAGKVTLTFAPYSAYVLGAKELPKAAVLPKKPVGQNPFRNECQQRYMRANRKFYEGKANWIWDAAKLQANAKCRVALEFNLADTDVPVELLCAADDGATIYLNGFEVKKIDDWRNMYGMNLRKFLRHGSNLLVIEGQDIGSLPCGILAELNINGKKLLSDNQWKVLPIEGKVPARKPANYDKLSAIKVMAKYGDKPWGKMVKVIPEN